MRKFVFIICLSVFVMDCKKQHNPTPQGYIGNWELRAQSGGIAGTSNHFPPGNGHELQLAADSTFKYYEGATIINQGTFRIIKNSLTYGTQNFDGIYYNFNTEGLPIQLQGDSLSIGIDFDDQIVSLYVRQ